MENNYNDSRLLEIGEILGLKNSSKISGVYFLILHGKIIYIGCSKNIIERVCTHRIEKHFDYPVFIPCPENEMFELEKAYIKKFKPELNRVHNPDAKAIRIRMGCKRGQLPPKPDKFEQIKSWQMEGRKIWGKSGSFELKTSVKQ